MRHIDRAPTAWEDLPETTSARGGYAYRTIVTNGPDADLATGRSATHLLHWPKGTTAPWGTDDQLEYHTLHEEIFVLEGILRFDRWYSLQALAYCNHPPFWVHPTNFWAETDLTMLVRESHDPVVQLQSIPNDWDGQDFYADGKPTKAAEGVSHLQLDELPWEGVQTLSGHATGIDAKRIWYDVDDGWTTWLMRVPPEWSLPLTADHVPGGDEVFVLEGDLTIIDQSRQVTLKRYGFAAGTASFGSSAGWESRGGSLFLRWTKGASAAWVTP